MGKKNGRGSYGIVVHDDDKKINPRTKRLTEKYRDKAISVMMTRSMFEKRSTILENKTRVSQISELRANDLADSFNSSLSFFPA